MRPGRTSSTSSRTISAMATSAATTPSRRSRRRTSTGSRRRGCGSPTPTRPPRSARRRATPCSPAGTAWRSRLQRNVHRRRSRSPLIDANRLTVAGAASRARLYHRLHRQVAPRLGLAATAARSGRRLATSTSPSRSPTGRRLAVSTRYFGTDVPNYPPYCFIENDRTVGIPSEAAPVGRESFRIAGPMLPGWKLVDVLPGLARDRAVQHIEAAAKATEAVLPLLAADLAALPRRPGTRVQGDEQGRRLRRLRRPDRSCGRPGARRAGANRGSRTIRWSSSPATTARRSPARSIPVPTTGSSSTATPAWTASAAPSAMPGRAAIACRSSPAGRGKIEPGTTSDETICHVDFMATRRGDPRRELPADAGVDSVNILPVLLARNSTSRSAKRPCTTAGRGSSRSARGRGSSSWPRAATTTASAASRPGSPRSAATLRTPAPASFTT